MKHIDNYCWRRDREKQKEMGPDWLIRNNQKHSERAQIAEDEYGKRHLMIEGYKDDLPFKNPNWMRTDNPAAEVHPPRRYGNRTENERLLKSI